MISRELRRVELQRMSQRWLVSRLIELGGVMPRSTYQTWSMHDLRVEILRSEYPPVEAK